MPLEQQAAAGESGVENDFDLDAAIGKAAAGVDGADPSATPNAVPPSDPPPEEDDIPLPKAWKKDMEPYWKQAPKELRRYAAEVREADVNRGIQMYRDGHERWNKLLTPYQEILQQYPDVDPVQLLNGLMQSHLKLSFGTPEEKRAMAQELMRAYAIEMDAAAQQQQAAPVIPPELNHRLSALEQERAQEKRAAVMREVEGFFADPKNAYAKDVAQDILGFVQKGHALAEAYNLAIWSNSAVRAKLIAKERAATSTSKLNVGADSDAPSPAPRAGTMDDTMKAVIAKHFNGVSL